MLHERHYEIGYSGGYDSELNRLRLIQTFSLTERESSEQRAAEDENHLSPNCRRTLEKRRLTQAEASVMKLDSSSFTSLSVLN